jgi:hypothetical protein
MESMLGRGSETRGGPTLSRRALIVGGLAGGLVVLLDACGGSSRKALPGPASSSTPISSSDSSGESSSTTTGQATSVLPSATQLWAPEFMSPSDNPTVAQALAGARSYSLISARAPTYLGQLSAMKAANRDLKLLIYLNGTYAQKGQGGAFPAAWYARNGAEEQVRSKAYGNFLMDPTDPGWIQNRVSTAMKFLDENAADGVLVDVIGPAPVEPGYNTSLPVNNGATWDATSWMMATSALLKTIKASLGQGLVYGNGLGQGSSYFDSTAPTSVLLDVLDGGMAEDFIRSATDPIDSFRSIADWQADVRMLADAAARGKPVVVTTKAWVPGTTAQKDALHKYALGAFFLGAGEGARFAFLYDAAGDPATEYNPFAQLQLGSPTAAYRVESGVYIRSFQRGMVAVNPNNATTTTPVAQPALRRMTSGSEVGSSLQLAPNSAEILTSS